MVSATKRPAVLTRDQFNICCTIYKQERPLDCVPSLKPGGDPVNAGSWPIFFRKKKNTK